MSRTACTPRHDARSTQRAGRPRALVAALLLAVALPLSACGDDTVDPAPAPAPAEPTETSGGGLTTGATQEDGGTEAPVATPSEGAGPSDGVPTDGVTTDG